MTAPRPIRAAAGTAEFLAIVDAAVPARPGHDHTRPMCAAWDDHRNRATPVHMHVAAREGADEETLADRVRQFFGWSGPTQRDYQAVEGPR